MIYVTSAAGAEIRGGKDLIDHGELWQINF